MRCGVLQNAGTRTLCARCLSLGRRCQRRVCERPLPLQAPPSSSSSSAGAGRGASLAYGDLGEKLLQLALVQTDAALMRLALSRGVRLEAASGPAALRVAAVAGDVEAIWGWRQACRSTSAAGTHARR